MDRKEEIKKQISQLQNELKAIERDEVEIARINWHINNKHCISCKNRDKTSDFSISDGIVCTHSSNQNGKDKFKYYCSTCKFWKQE